ncbi:hypothetical protein BDR04DRAFT_1023286, partial [Suillus decipiens]
IVRIFHVNVEYCENKYSHYSQPRCMEVLFVHWFRRDGLPAGFSAKRLQCFQFFDKDSLNEAFGFLDPDSIICGVHIIPAFAYSCTDTLLGPSFVHKEEELDTDWHYYYVNMYVLFSPLLYYSLFVDRDIFMRFCGGRIGHKAMQDWDDFLQGAKADTSAQEDSEMRGDKLDLEDKGDMEDLDMQEEGTDGEDSTDEEEGTVLDLEYTSNSELETDKAHSKIYNISVM